MWLDGLTSSPMSFCGSSPLLPSQSHRLRCYCCRRILVGVIVAVAAVVVVVTAIFLASRGHTQLVLAEYPCEQRKSRGCRISTWRTTMTSGVWWIWSTGGPGRRHCVRRVLPRAASSRPTNFWVPLWGNAYLSIAFSRVFSPLLRLTHHV